MRRIVHGLAALTLSVALAGCGGDGEPEATPSTGASPSASESGSTPTDEPSETVAPIEGVTRSVDGVSATVPKDWKQTQFIGQLAFYEKRGPEGYQAITLGALPWYTKPSLAQVIRDSKERADFEGKVQRLDDLTGPGSTPMFHIRGTTHQGTADVVGGANATHTFEVQITSDLPAAEHEALVESVIPTIGFDR